jgi:hypothetical protein
LRRGEGRRESEGSEDQVSPLPQEVPVGELVAESEAPVLREAEDVELVVIHELGDALHFEVCLDSVQVLGPKGHLSGLVRVSVAKIHEHRATT